MRNFIFLSLFSLCFATGFTCSKSTPTTESPSTNVAPEMPQEQMAAPPAADGQAGVAPLESSKPTPSPAVQ